jgi:hypothetical protein
LAAAELLFSHDKRENQMALERLYTIVFENVTVAAVQDLLTVKAGATNGLELRRLSLSASGVTSAAEIRIRLKRLPATVTLGSGGSTPTIQKVSSRLNISPLSTAHANDTTQATTSGTAATLANWSWQVLQDFLEVPPTEGERWECDVSEALVLDVIAAPASTVLSGIMVFKET